MDDSKLTGPLAGFKVVDLTANVLGPLATQMLGDAGAEVIKIEAPGGDPMRSVGPMRSAGMGAMFVNLNRNKKSVVLDLKRSQDQDLLFELIGGADIFVHSIRPEAAQRLGIDYPALKERFPRIVYASACGYRRGSTEANKPAYDDAIQGRSGLAWLNRDDQGSPRFLPTVVADKHCGYALAYGITLAALHRERTGEGQEVLVPMMDTMVAFNLIEHLWGATLCDPSLGLGYPRLTTPNRRPYRTADGYLCVTAITDEQWQRLFLAIGRKDLIRDPRFAEMEARTQHIHEVLEILADALASKSTGDWVEILSLADIPYAVPNDLEQLMNDPYLREVDFFRSHDHPTEGEILQLAPSIELSRSPLSIRDLAPLLDQDGAEVRDLALGR